jgi:putative transposase
MVIASEDNKKKLNNTNDEAGGSTFLVCGNHNSNSTMRTLVGSLKTETFLALMDWQAAKAQRLFEQTGQVTVIVLDNASVHKSQLVSQRLEGWQHQGLLLFFLPPYSPQMNRIEDEWLHLKRDELAGRVFEDEYDLSVAIRDGIEAKANRGNYAVERFIFN